MTNCRVGASCQANVPPDLVSWKEMLTVAALPLKKSPRAPLSRSIAPSSKWDWPSLPVQIRTHRIIATSCCLSVVTSRHRDLAAEDGVADCCVDQHQRE